MGAEEETNPRKFPSDEYKKMYESQLANFSQLKTTNAKIS